MERIINRILLLLFIILAIGCDNRINVKPRQILIKDNLYVKDIKKEIRTKPYTYRYTYYIGKLYVKDTILVVVEELYRDTGPTYELGDLFWKSK